MEKKLSEMSLEELWTLFPIILSEHDANWKNDYITEKELLISKISSNKIYRIEHIGSTSIPNILAKPTIDILIEVRKEDLSIVQNQIAQAGYTQMYQSMNRIGFNKGYTIHGFAKKVFHLHLREINDHDELYFRDYLLKYPDVAKEYEKLKIQLSKLYEHNRDAYTEGKTDFIVKMTKLAKVEFDYVYDHPIRIGAY